MIQTTIKEHMKFITFIILVQTIFFAIFLTMAKANESAEFIKENLCEKFTGVFYWDNSNRPQYVNAYVKNIRIDNNLVIIEGNGDYVSASGVTFIKFQWWINSIDYHIKIQESQPTRASFETDGFYEGEISNNLIKINTIWETRLTGRTGTLELNADKSCKPLTLS